MLHWVETIRDHSAMIRRWTERWWTLKQLRKRTAKNNVHYEVSSRGTLQLLWAFLCPTNRMQTLLLSLRDRQAICLMFMCEVFDCYLDWTMTFKSFYKVPRAIRWIGPNKISNIWQKWGLNLRSPDQTSNCDNQCTTECLRCLKRL